MQDYKKLRVWKEAHELLLQIYKLTKGLPKEELYHLVSQTRRACSSIPFNIVEGCGRKTDKDKVHFIQISYSSACELEYQLLVLKDLKLIDDQDYEKVLEKAVSVKRMIFALLKKMRIQIKAAS